MRIYFQAASGVFCKILYEMVPDDEGTVEVPDMGFDDMINLYLWDPATGCIKNKIILEAVIKPQNSKVKNV